MAQCMALSEISVNWPVNNSAVVFYIDFFNFEISSLLNINDVFYVFV